MASSSSNDDLSGAPLYLPRGAACVSCRRRKMKCDGHRPVCGPCARSQRPDDCEYVSGNERSTVQILEENINQLEARIRELQQPQSIHHLQLNQVQTTGHSSAGTDSASFSNIQDPPREIAEKLLDRFLPFAGDFGFFLNGPRFRASFLQPFPSGHPARPAPAVIFSTYLLAIHFSKDPSIKARESAYMEKAIYESSRAVTVNHPHKMLHSIQAEVMLAYYFFANGRFIEGKHHVAYAVSTGLSAGLHKIRSSAPSGPPSPLPPPIDPVDEGERILAAWTLFNLDSAWAIALQSTPNFEHADGSPASKVDTPWPLEMEDFEQAKLPAAVRTSQTVHKFLNGIPTGDVGLSSRAVESKAVVLWDRANSLVARYNDGSPSQDITRLTTEIALLERVTESLKASVLPPAQLTRLPNNEVAKRMAVAYSIIGASIIRLHGIFARSNEISRRKRLTAAQMILEVAAFLSARRLDRINPIMGFIWIEASQVLFDEVSLARAMRAENRSWTGVDDSRYLDLIRGALTTMEIFTPDLPLLGFQVKKVCETLRAMA